MKIRFPATLKNHTSFILSYISKLLRKTSTIPKLYQQTVKPLGHLRDEVLH